MEDKTELEFERLTTDTSFASQLSEEDVMKVNSAFYVYMLHKILTEGLRLQDELIWRQFLTLSPYPTKTQEMMESGTDFEKGLDSLMDFDKALTVCSFLWLLVITY